MYGAEAGKAETDASLPRVRTPYSHSRVDTNEKSMLSFLIAKALCSF